MQSMTEWSDISADIAITDPPFGIDFTAGKTNYNRDESYVVDGYVEWDKEQYEQKITDLLTVLYENTVDTGQALIFSGKDNSHIVHQQIEDHEWTLEGKLYWSYNFAPYCTRRPAHNVYEIYWVRKTDDWYYENECSFDHCQNGEANLSVLDINREYLTEMPKYPTRLAPKLVRVLLEHFSEPGDTVFDPLAGSGTVGIVSVEKNRDAYLGDINEEGADVFQATARERFFNE